MKHDADSFPAKLKALREARNLSLQDLGEAATLSKQRVHQLEAGTHVAKWPEIQQLATALGVTPNDLCDS